MNRRNTLKALAASSVGVLAIGYWASDKIFIDETIEKSFFTENEQNLITSIADTIIPKTNLYGALDLGVPIYLLGYFEKCTEEKDQQIIKSQLKVLNDLAHEKYKLDFTDCSAIERKDLLLSFSESELEDQKYFFNTMKDQTIHGFRTTKEVMTNQYHYQIVPGFMKGCIDISEESIT